MKTIVNPKAQKCDAIHFQSSPNSGLISYMDFSNPVFWSQLQEMFRCCGNEYLIGIQITENGILANIGHKKF